MSNIIVINRGDSYQFNLRISDGQGGEFVPKPEDSDVIYFGLMDPHQTFENALIKKRYTVEDFKDKETGEYTAGLNIKIKPEDTLDLFPGVYYYAIKMHRVSKKDNIDEVITIINKTKFIIND